MAKLKEEFADLGLTYSIGGQISFDVFPKVSVASLSLLCYPVSPHALRRTVMCLDMSTFSVVCAGLGQNLLPTVCGTRFR